MIILFRKGDNLFVKCELNLKRAVQYQEKIFKVGKHTELLLPEEVMCILTKNGNIKLWNGVKFIKMNLGQFNDVMSNNQFKVEVFVEDKPQKVEEPVKIVHPEPIVEEVKPVVQPQKVEEPVKVEVEEDINKKKRHKQNQQGGDK
jgi:hypothetical protein